jgi:hypothetical protein
MGDKPLCRYVCLFHVMTIRAYRSFALVRAGEGLEPLTCCFSAGRIRPFDGVASSGVWPGETLHGHQSFSIS